MLLPTHVTTAPQSNAVTLWRVTVRVTSMKLVGVASVIRVWSPMVYEAVTPDSWMLRVVSGKPRARQVKVTLSPAAAITSVVFSPLMTAVGATACREYTYYSRDYSTRSGDGLLIQSLIQVLSKVRTEYSIRVWSIDGHVWQHSCMSLHTMYCTSHLYCCTH